MYNILGDGSSQSLEEQPGHQGLVSCCDESPCFGHTAFILTTLVSSPCLCFSPSPFSPSLSAVTHSLHLLMQICISQRLEVAIKEVAFSLGVGVCTAQNAFHNLLHRDQMFWSYRAPLSPIAILCTDKCICHLWYQLPLKER